ncbi:hypothetical protein IWZ03DRAFT_187456 [Phyllosticta citriasiana]|uniref:Uncharacterized protein n=1 Tax=Phyllosticta citriasiana TaxID=595635 RepID=A0ABR1KJR9_9PEZI
MQMEQTPHCISHRVRPLTHHPLQIQRQHTHIHAGSPNFSAIIAHEIAMTLPPFPYPPPLPTKEITAPPSNPHIYHPQQTRHHRHIPPSPTYSSVIDTEITLSLRPIPPSFLFPALHQTTRVGSIGYRAPLTRGGDMLYPLFPRAARAGWEDEGEDEGEGEGEGEKNRDRATETGGQGAMLDEDGEDEDGGAGGAGGAGTRRTVVFHSETGTFEVRRRRRHPPQQRQECGDRQCAQEEGYNVNVNTKTPPPPYSANSISISAPAPTSTRSEKPGDKDALDCDSTSAISPAKQQDLSSGPVSRQRRTRRVSRLVEWGREVRRRSVW